ncbi:WEB family protein At1g75720-like [Juglans microcarpa x Juglans regia]|uniref:WEB family protein At1g75720-like n=1 Tax=Juglans microcarpa x Juglans regia TaxID=2249226 RepID=UPI001B7E18BE|nr:WEB family protein At1g75720-like [Juglans microcarpa x Juglans regia]
MESHHSTNIDCSSKVDASRPFRSVKEAVAIYDERLLLGEFFSPKPCVNIPKQETSWNFSPIPTESKLEDLNDHRSILDTLKKLEAELKETKVELKLLKERESETEVALASLNAELHKNMSKLAEAEAAAAAKAVAATEMMSLERASSRIREEERKRELMYSMEDSTTLAQILSLGKEGYFGIEKKRMKKKPIIPLLGDLFSRKKRSSTALRT